MMILHSNTRNDEAAIQYQSSISMGPDQVQNSGAPAEDSAAYYNSGSKEAAEETPLTLERLEPRRKLTKNSTRLVIILVGLPARGKSFVARKLQNFITWNGHHCKIFNVGKYRRQAYAERTETTGACDANFFDSKNAEAAALRENVAEIALQDMLRWLDDDDSDSEHGENAKKASDLDSNRRDVTSVSTLIDDVPRAQRIAIFDATNSTKKRRQWVLEQCSSPQLRPGKPTGCVFVESVCDDAELLLENFRFKISNSPDYKGMSHAEALIDLQNRVQKYEEQYETIDDDSLSYIKIFNLSTKILVNHIYGRMSKTIVPALMAWNIGTRPIFLCRPGQTLSDLTTDGEDYVSQVNLSESKLMNVSAQARRHLLRGDSLGPSGKKFSNALYDFVFEEGADFVLKRASIIDMAHTGTSKTGLATGLTPSTDGIGRDAQFPLQVFTSTMPRAAQTVLWEDYDFNAEQLSNLNPLDKGDFVGKELEEIQKSNPGWYNKLEKNPFCTRFPGGESYRDLIKRLESVVVDLEQQVIPTLVVSHVSCLQVLIAYFRTSPVEKCMEIEVPLHTVLKFTPARGGGWTESQHFLCPADDGPLLPPVTSISSEMSNATFENCSITCTPSTPIWGDHIRKSSTVSLEKSRHSAPVL